jgi:hypothetical protein
MTFASAPRMDEDSIMTWLNHSNLWNELLFGIFMLVILQRLLLPLIVHLMDGKARAEFHQMERNK